MKPQKWKPMVMASEKTTQLWEFQISMDLKYLRATGKSFIVFYQKLFQIFSSKANIFKNESYERNQILKKKVVLHARQVDVLRWRRKYFINASFINKQHIILNEEHSFKTYYMSVLKTVILTMVLNFSLFIEEEKMSFIKMYAELPKILCYTDQVKKKQIQIFEIYCTFFE